MIFRAPGDILLVIALTLIGLDAAVRAEEKSRAQDIACPELIGYRIETRQQSIVVLDDRGTAVGRVLPWSGSEVQADDVLEPAGEWLVRWRRSFRLKDGQPRQQVRLVMDFEAAHACRFATIPGISWNGNKNDSGNVYHDFAFQGTPWSFAWHRTLVPGATYSEGDRHTVALFADVSDPSVGLACSLIPSGQTTVHRLIFPEEEMPARIVKRVGPMSPGRAGLLELAPGQVFTATAWLVLHPLERPRTGYRHMLDAAWRHFYKEPVAQRSVEELRELSIHFIKSMWNKDNGKFFVAWQHNFDGNGNDTQWTRRPHFSLGWTPRNAEAANAMLAEYLRTKDETALKMGLACFDAYAAHVDLPKLSAAQPGVVTEHFRNMAGDINNLGEGACEFFKAHELAARCQQPRPLYRRLALAICDEAVANQQADGSFRGYGADKMQIGGSMIPPLLRAYDVTRDARYLKAACSAMGYYMAAFYKEGYLGGGTLDTPGIDKETVFPLLVAALHLYELTREKDYLIQAEDLGWYHSSWQFAHSVPNVPGSFMEGIQMETFGGCSVSTMHMCGDAYSLQIVEPLTRLARYTSNNQWLQRALGIWACGSYGISDGTMELDGKPTRPRGGQNETYCYTDWGIYGEENPRGRGCRLLTIWSHTMRLETLFEPGMQPLLEAIAVKHPAAPVPNVPPQAGQGNTRATHKSKRAHH